MLIVITTAITYTSYSMNQVTQLAETIGVQQEIKEDKFNESFDVVAVNIVNDQFNMTVKNIGDVPVHLTRLWIENTTDSSWPVSKFDIDFSLAPGDTVKNIGQGVGLTALATQSYHAQIISDRGNQKEMFLNTVWRFFNIHTSLCISCCNAYWISNYCNFGSNQYGYYSTFEFTT